MLGDVWHLLLEPSDPPLQHRVKAHTIFICPEGSSNSDLNKNWYPSTSLSIFEAIKFLFDSQLAHYQCLDNNVALWQKSDRCLKTTRSVVM